MGWSCAGWGGESGRRFRGLPRTSLRDGPAGPTAVIPGAGSGGRLRAGTPGDPRGCPEARSDGGSGGRPAERPAGSRWGEAVRAPGAARGVHQVPSATGGRGTRQRAKVSTGRGACRVRGAAGGRGRVLAVVVQRGRLVYDVRGCGGDGWDYSGVVVVGGFREGVGDGWDDAGVVAGGEGVGGAGVGDWWDDACVVVGGGRRGCVGVDGGDDAGVVVCGRVRLVGVVCAAVSRRSARARGRTGRCPVVERRASEPRARGRAGLVGLRRYRRGVRPTERTASGLLGGERGCLVGVWREGRVGRPRARGPGPRRGAGCGAVRPAEFDGRRGAGSSELACLVAGRVGRVSRQARALGSFGVPRSGRRVGRSGRSPLLRGRPGAFFVLEGGAEGGGRRGNWSLETPGLERGERSRVVGDRVVLGRVLADGVVRGRVLRYRGDFVGGFVG